MATASISFKLALALNLYASTGSNEHAIFNCYYKQCWHVFYINIDKNSNQALTHWASSYLYESISTFETGIFNKVCQLQSQLMPQPGNLKRLFHFQLPATIVQRIPYKESVNSRVN